MSSPKLIFKPKKRYDIQFSGTVGAGAGTGLTLVAGAITFPYRVIGAEIVFPSDAADNLLIYLLISRDTTTSAGAPPADQNLFAPFTPSAYFVGSNLIKRVQCNVEAETEQRYLKVHALNNNTYQQTVNVTITIEEA